MPEKWIILDCSEFAKESVKAAVEAAEPGCRFFEIAPGAEAPVDAAVGFVSLKKERGELGAYAVVADDPAPYKARLVSNNVFGASEAVSAAKGALWALSNFGEDAPRSQDDLTFFCSDFHFNHGNIIKYCNRPWNSGAGSDGQLVVTEDDVRRMNDDMVRNFNKVVPGNAVTWFLGDFCMGQRQRESIPEFVSRLNGRINIVLGNHDRHSVKFYYDAGFNRVYDHPVVLNGFMVLSHAPMEFVKAPWFNVYGHVHDCATYRTWSGDSCCVCVERHGYRPVSLAEIKKKYEELNGKDA